MNSYNFNNATILQSSISCNVSNSCVTIPPEVDVTEDDRTESNFYLIVAIVQTIICLVGILFNVLNLFVLVQLVRRKRSVSPTYHLLIAMGVADLMVLSFVSFYFIAVYLRRPPLPYGSVTEERPDFYHVIHYIWYFPVNPFSIASNWLVMATTVFRFLAVAFPLKVCQWCTLVRMRIAIVLIFALAVAVNCPDWLTVKVYTREDGAVRANSTDLYGSDTLKPYYYVYHTLEIYIPFLVDLVLVIFLIVKLNSTTASMAESMQDGNAEARVREHRKIGIMLIAIVIWFLICNTIVFVYHIMRDTAGEEREKLEQTPYFQKLSIIKDFGHILNHAGNIVFYCLCNNTYRKTFINTLLCRKKVTGSQSQHTVMTSVSTRNGKRSVSNSNRQARYSFIDKIDRLGLIPTDETRGESIILNKLGFGSNTSGFDVSGVNVLASDPLLEMYHSGGKHKP